MSTAPIKIAIPVSVSRVYCPECKNTYFGGLNAYSYFSFATSTIWHHSYIEYDSAAHKKDIKCECPKCGTMAIPIFTAECDNIVRELSGAGFEIVSAMDRVDISLVGSIGVKASMPLRIQFKIPQLIGITEPVKIGNPFDSNFTIEKMYDDVYELSSTKESIVDGELAVHEIKSNINEIKAKDWYETKCRDYAHSIKSKLDSMRDKDDSKAYRAIMSLPMEYKRNKNSNLFAGIVVEDHKFLTFIGEDKTLPGGVEVVLKSGGDIKIEFYRDFDVDATDKWLNDILERMDKHLQEHKEA